MRGFFLSFYYTTQQMKSNQGILSFFAENRYDIF